MPIPTYGQVTIDKDTWDRLNARVEALEKRLLEMQGECKYELRRDQYGASFAWCATHHCVHAITTTK